MRVLSWMALLGMFVSPISASDYCSSYQRCYYKKYYTSCGTCYYKKVCYDYCPPKADPVAVFVPSYTATIAPYAVAAPLYAAPAPGPTAAVAGQAALYSQQANVQYGSLGAAQIQAQQQVQQQAVYQPPVQQQAPAPSSLESELASALRQINQRLCTLEDRLPAQGPVIGPRFGVAPPPPVRGGVQIPRVFNKCTACHTSGSLRGDKNEFVMFDKGKLIPFSERNLRLIGAKVSIGVMPPPGNKEGIPAATDEESQELSEWINKQ